MKITEKITATQYIGQKETGVYEGTRYMIDTEVELNEGDVVSTENPSVSDFVKKYNETLRIKSENGISRMVIERPEELMEIFTFKNINCYLRKVVVVKIDTPLKLNSIFKLSSANDLNIEYLYTYKENYLVFKIENIKKAEDLLKDNKFILLEEN